MDKSILSGFLIFGVIQAIIFAGLFFSKRKRSGADNTLILWLLTFAAHSILILINQNIAGNGFTRIFPVSFTLLYGPYLFIYVTLVKSCKRNPINIYLHIIPFVIFSILSIVLHNDIVFKKLVSFCGLLSGITYCSVTFYKIKAHKSQILEHFSSIDKVNLKWIERFVISIIMIWLGVFIILGIKQIYSITISLDWFFISIPLIISYIGFYGLKQQLIFSPIEISQNTTSSNKEISIHDKKESKSYSKSGLNKDDMIKIHNSLINVVDDQKLYRHAGLSLKELSEKTNIPQHHITQTLNLYANKSFYNFINQYRVEEFKERVNKGDAEEFSLLGIAFDCGFNSKSSFNRIFKNLTGLSPSEYKNHLN